jgi:L-aminopeptidase/D-esterase-like protein
LPSAAGLRPDAATGHAACEAAMCAPAGAADTVAQGNVGAGCGAVVGKLAGLGSAMRGGLGTASLRAGPWTVAALVVVNAAGDVLDEAGRVIAGLRDGNSLCGSVAAMLAGVEPRSGGFGAAPAGHALQGQATTIGVVATDARLDVAQATLLARLAHHGLSRAVAPVLPTDGDTLFALATGSNGATPDMALLGTAAAEAVTRAIRNGVRHAQRLQGAGLPDLPAAADMPRAA